MVEREVEAWAAFLKDELFSEMVLVDESRSSGVMRPDYIATDPSWDGTHVIQGPPILIVKELDPSRFKRSWRPSSWRGTRRERGTFAVSPFAGGCTESALIPASRLVRVLGIACLPAEVRAKRVRAMRATDFKSNEPSDRRGMPGRHYAKQSPRYLEWVSVVVWMLMKAGWTIWSEQMPDRISYELAGWPHWRALVSHFAAVAYRGTEVLFVYISTKPRGQWAFAAKELSELPAFLPSEVWRSEVQIWSLHDPHEPKLATDYGPSCPFGLGRSDAKHFTIRQRKGTQSRFAVGGFMVEWLPVAVLPVPFDPEPASSSRSGGEGGAN